AGSRSDAPAARRAGPCRRRTGTPARVPPTAGRRSPPRGTSRRPPRRTGLPGPRSGGRSSWGPHRGGRRACASRTTPARPGRSARAPRGRSPAASAPSAGVGCSSTPSTHLLSRLQCRQISDTVKCEGAHSVDSTGERNEGSRRDTDPAESGPPDGGAAGPGRESRMWQSGGMPRTLYRDAALADGTGPDLRVGVSLLVDGDRIEWIRPADDEPDPGPDVTVIDASGCTIVPGMV